jgi:hypothetical protein
MLRSCSPALHSLWFPTFPSLSCWHWYIQLIWVTHQPLGWACGSAALTEPPLWWSWEEGGGAAAKSC